MMKSAIDRRTFNQILPMSLAATTLPSSAGSDCRNCCMSQSRSWFRRSFTVGLGLAAAAVATVTVRSATDKWWPGYGGGPDNSRFFASRQINKSNVNQLQVAWTYPYGDTGSHPIVVRGVVYGRGRNGSLVAVDAKTGKERWIRESMNGMTSRGFNYWESRDGRDQRLIFAMDSLLQEVD